jgi:hypothetical protein
MKSKTIALIVATTLLQVLLAITPLIPYTSHFWHADNPVEFYTVFATVVGMQFAILTAAVLLTTEGEVSKITASISNLLSVFPYTKVLKLKDFQFYTHFKSAVELADHSVRISYHAPYPPTDVSFKERKKYYDEILALMKRSQRVHFKRLVRSTPRNDVWLMELIRECDGRSNIDIASLDSDVQPHVEMPLAMSVQIVDEKQCWLVAISTHERDAEYRDLYVENQDVAICMRDYFDRIWDHSTLLLNRGRITEAGEALIARVRGAV